MEFKRNIGTVDLVVRVFILLGFIALAILVHPLFYILVGTEIMMLITGICPVYTLLKMNTLRKKKKLTKRKVR